VSSTCFEQPSVHLQEVLYIQFMVFYHASYILLVLITYLYASVKKSKNKHASSIENVLSSYHIFLPALFRGTAQ